MYRSAETDLPEDGLEPDRRGETGFDRKVLAISRKLNSNLLAHQKEAEDVTCHSKSQRRASMITENRGKMRGGSRLWISSDG